MVQVSDFVDLIAGGDVAKQQTKIFSGEAHMLWEHLQQRHDYLELTLVCLNNITDTEFKMIVEKGLRDTMKSQIKKVEDLLTSYGIPFPEGAPQSIKTKGDPEIWRDEMVFNMLLVGIRWRRRPKINPGRGGSCHLELSYPALPLPGND